MYTATTLPPCLSLAKRPVDFERLQTTPNDSKRLQTTRRKGSIETEEVSSIRRSFSNHLLACPRSASRYPYVFYLKAFNVSGKRWKNQHCPTISIYDPSTNSTGTTVREFESPATASASSRSRAAFFENCFHPDITFLSSFVPQTSVRVSSCCEI